MNTEYTVGIQGRISILVPKLIWRKNALIMGYLMGLVLSGLHLGKCSYCLNCVIQLILE